MSCMYPEVLWSLSKKCLYLGPAGFLSQGAEDCDTSAERTEDIVLMAEEKPIDKMNLSPLDQIRLCEAEVTRRVAAARQAAGESLAKARSEAASLKKQAKERGAHKGQTQYEEIISRSEDEAKLMLAQAQRRSEELLQRGLRRIDEAVRKAVNIVIGLEGDKSKL